jgi:hypothetical protein
MTDIIGSALFCVISIGFRVVSWSFSSISKAYEPPSDANRETKPTESDHDYIIG